MARGISMATRKELVQALGQRYRVASRGEKGRILDEFIAVTGYHCQGSAGKVHRRFGQAGPPWAVRAAASPAGGARRGSWPVAPSGDRPPSAVTPSAGGTDNQSPGQLAGIPRRHGH